MSKIDALLAASPMVGLVALVGTMVVLTLRKVREVDDALDCWGDDLSADWDPAEFDMAPTMSADWIKPYNRNVGMEEL